MPKTYPPDLEQFVQQELANGRYQSEDELLIDALSVFREMKQRHAALCRDVQRSIEQADRGESSPLDTEATIAEGRRRLSEQG
jgi:putative addiction module CopG family antidote